MSGLQLAIASACHEVAVELARRASSTDFKSFLKFFAWPVLQPSTSFADNWHIGAICEHLQAVQTRQIKRLIINLPFRSLKSTLVSQAFPAWDWTIEPHSEHLTISYAKDIATRDAVQSRNIINSDLYQRAFGNLFRLVSDQNVKTRYENDKAGKRTIASTDGATTGFGGDRIFIDDPISAKEADSAQARAQAVEFWRGTASSRLNNPATGTIVVVHQRLHANDLTGYILAEEAGWDHLVLPMRADKTVASRTQLNFKDPRNEGDLLFPSRLDEETVQGIEATLGSYHTAAQLQQAPTSRGGVIFNRNNWRFYSTPPEIEEMVMSVDCTFKDLVTSDYVAIQVWGRKGANKYLLYRSKAQLGFSATVLAVRAVHAMFPHCIATLIEDKANGSAVIETITSEISGVVPINPEGGKVARAYAMEPEHEAGNIHLPDPSLDPDIEAFLNEVSGFPGLAHDDEVDAMTQAINWFRTREREMGVFNYYAGQANAKAKAH